LTPANAAAHGAFFRQVPPWSASGGGLMVGAAPGNVYEWSAPIDREGQATLRLRLERPPVVETSVFVSMGFDSPTMIAATPPLGRIRVGEPVDLEIVLKAPTSASSAARATAEVHTPSHGIQLATLRDEGTLRDWPQSYRVFRARFVPASEGPHAVHFLVSLDVGGSKLIRQARMDFTAQHPVAEIARVWPAAMHDTNGNGRVDELRVSALIEVRKPSHYVVEATLRAGDRRLREIVGAQWSAGPHLASVVFPSSLLEAEGVGAGLYELESIVLAEVPPGDHHNVQTVARRVSIDLSGMRFEQPPLRLTGQSSFSGYERTATGLWRSLALDLEIESSRKQFYTASAALYSGKRRVASCAGRQIQPAGVSRLRLLCTGREIGSQRIDGPYTAKGLWMYGNTVGPDALNLSVSGPFAVSGPLRAADFVGSDRRPEDVDGDGHVSCNDLVRVKLDIGLRLGDMAYDPRHDVDGDRAVTAADVAAVRAALPASQTCPGI
jgi:hypothetical protein